MSGTNFSQADLDAIAAASAKYNLPSWLLPGIAYKETRGETNPDTAVSSTGAVGLMQILPSTAAAPGYGVVPVARASLTDPNVSADFAGAYAQGIYSKTGNWADVVSRYSGGEYNLASVQAGAALMPAAASTYANSGANAKDTAIAAANNANATSAAVSSASFYSWLGSVLSNTDTIIFGIIFIAMGLIFMLYRAKNDLIYNTLKTA